MLKKILRAIYKNFLIGRTETGIDIKIQPWNFPEIMLLHILRNSRDSYNCFVVGAYHGHEVSKLLETKHVKTIVLFEPEPTNIQNLRKTIAANSKYTEIVEAAVSDRDGECTFHEMNLPGNGSILAPSPLAIASYGTRQIRSLTVKTLRLDTFAKNRAMYPDILWIDVQGAELGVLKGAEACLKSARYIFIEVSTWTPTYTDGCTTHQLVSLLEYYGFRPTQLGTDLLNGTGNALFVKRETMELDLIKFT
jgi:FkbM family methyltransferase